MSHLGFADVNGTRLYHEEQGSGKSVVFVHGFTLDCHMWDFQFQVFSEKFRVVRYDARGFGKSAVPASKPYSHAEDLKALLDFLRIPTASLVGMSMGGRTAVEFALRFPDALDALVLVDAALDGYAYSEYFSELLQAPFSVAKEVGVPPARELWLGIDLFTPALENPAVSPRLRQMVSDYSGWHWLHDNPVKVLDPPALKRLKEVVAPTLILVGQLDLDDFQKIAQVLQEGIPNGRKIMLPGAGHMSNMEAAEEFNEIVLDFLGSALA